MNVKYLENYMKNPKSSDSFNRSILCSGLLLLLCLNFGFAFTGQAQNYKPIKNTEAFKSLYAEKSSAMNTLKSDFIQEKSISMLKNKIISQGSFVFKKSNRLRMEYTSPYAYLFIMADDKITIKSDQQKSSVSVNSNKLFKMISQITIECVTGNVLTSKDFDIKVSENDKVYHLALMPRQKMIKSLFSEIELLISKGDFTVDRLKLIEASGDNTTLIFSNKKINNPVTDEIFKAN